ncbi:MAG TPA: DUF2336 domain-containing protein [Candidatus Cybelea sp.]|nr:DUF2336 domain-containing protein [Candidatus Cybelea sp.]
MMDYEKAKALAANADTETRLRLAERTDVQPEVLYFLAEDVEAEVRAAIAANTATPRHADHILAGDDDSGVRERLAHKIGRLAPYLSADESAHIRELTLDVIAILARDRTVRVREIIAQSLKDLTDAPVELVRQLARDVEIRVAGPILEASPLLSDEELVQIIESKPIQGALEAIAKRRRVGAPLSEALVAAALTVPDGAVAVATLLQNHKAEIGPHTMERILDVAPREAAWHEPLVRRPSLLPGAMRRLAAFVSDTLLDLLRRRPDADPATAAAIEETARHRESAADSADDDEDGGPAPVGERAILAAIDAGDARPVVAAIARDSGIARPIVRKILASASAKAILSLAWKAGYALPLAVALQEGPGRIADADVLAGDDGDAYPMADADMEWQLELFVPPEPITRRLTGR